MSLRPDWSTEQVSGQPELVTQRNPAWKNKQTNKEMKKKNLWPGTLIFMVKQQMGAVALCQPPTGRAQGAGVLEILVAVSNTSLMR